MIPLRVYEIIGGIIGTDLFLSIQEISDENRVKS
jgi:hypothetical protein